MIVRVVVLGREVLRIDTDKPDSGSDRVDDLDGRVAAPVGFVVDDLPTFHRRDEV